MFMHVYIYSILHILGCFHNSNTWYDMRNTLIGGAKISGGGGVSYIILYEREGGTGII